MPTRITPIWKDPEPKAGVPHQAGPVGHPAQPDAESPGHQCERGKEAGVAEEVEPRSASAECPSLHLRTRHNRLCIDPLVAELKAHLPRGELNG
jgi:hypothetical protein